jgi:hypothetical protein
MSLVGEATTASERSSSGAMRLLRFPPATSEPRAQRPLRESLPSAGGLGSRTIVLVDRLQPVRQLAEVHRRQLVYSESEVNEGCEGAGGGP